MVSLFRSQESDYSMYYFIKLFTSIFQFNTGNIGKSDQYRNMIIINVSTMRGEGKTPVTTACPEGG